MSRTVSHDRIGSLETHKDGSELNLSENALRVLQARYLKKDEKGKLLETPEQLFRRVASTIAAVEANFGATAQDIAQLEDQYYSLLATGKFMPNSPTLMNAGRKMGMLSACFVLPVRDSIDEIFAAIRHTALIQKAGGGTGFAFDELRPTGDFISSSGGTTSGPISFWRAFSEATNAIQQGAFRRGANMGMMYIHHPDILKFIHAKQDLKQFTNYNISIKLTDRWMKQFLAEPNSPHIVVNPRNGEEFYLPKDLEVWKYNIKTLQTVKDPQGKALEVDTSKVYTKADLWNLIVTNAHATGEPGVVFMDRINEDNPTAHIGRIEATNPCGEQPLLPYEACNLGSINAGKFVRSEQGKAWFDWDQLGRTVELSVRFLDDVIDANRFPLEQIDQMCKANRKIGLGIMGFADTLFKLALPYNSDQGLEFGEKLMKFINDRGHDASEALARKRNCFANWQGSIWDTTHQRPMRNAAVTTVAPSGTISIMANCSSGIEPLFSLVFFRNVLREHKSASPMIEINEHFRQIATERGFYSDQLMEQLAKKGSIQDIPGIPEDVKRVFVCAHDISPKWHLKMQAAFQKHCDASISKTINFPHDATVADVDKIYRLASEYRCKGITVYRDGCRKLQPMALKNDKSTGNTSVGAVTDETRKEAAAPNFEPVSVPDCLPAIRIRQMTPFGHMHVNITVDAQRGKEMEVFAQLGKGGDIAASDLEAICRMISLFLRSGGSLKHVIDQLKDIGSSLSIPSKGGRIMSLGDGLAKALMRYQRAKQRFGITDLLLGRADLTELDQPHGFENRGGDNGGNGNGGNGSGTSLNHYKIKCPECSSGTLVFEEGCVKCHGCGYAQC